MQRCYMTDNLKHVIQPAAVSRSVAWLRVILMAIAAFIFNTTEFVPVGLLTDIGASFSMDSEQVGIMLTIYAWCVALLSLPLMLLTRNIERRILLTLLLVIFTASHLLSAVAWSFNSLLWSRFGIAITHAVFWSINASLAIRIAPPGKKTQALSMIATGTALAMVLGVPLGRMIGQLLGWRATFGVIGISSFVLMLALFYTLPKLYSEHSGSLKSVPMLFRRPALVSMYLLVVIVVTAHYTTYSYIEPFIKQIALQDGSFTTLLLLLFGLAGLIGSTLFSWLGSRFPSSLLLTAILLITLCMALLYAVAAHRLEVSILCIIWGMGIMMINLSMQVRVLSLAPDATDVSMSLMSGIYNIGIGAGALAGAQISGLAGLSVLGYAGALIGFVSLLWCSYSFYKYPTLRSNL